MTALEMPLEYVIPEVWEKGKRLGIDFATYRELAHTALAITKNIFATMALYTYCGPDSQGAGLDIWTDSRSLTIRINRTAQELALFLAPNIDSPQDALLILSIINSPEGWRELGRIARQEITKP